MLVCLMLSRNWKCYALIHLWVTWGGQTAISTINMNLPWLWRNTSVLSGDRTRIPSWPMITSQPYIILIGSGPQWLTMAQRRDLASLLRLGCVNQCNTTHPCYRALREYWKRKGTQLQPICRPHHFSWYYLLNSPSFVIIYVMTPICHFILNVTSSVA